jgi:hypothetical protein
MSGKNTTLRHFYCRDDLWQSFARMSEDLDRGVDDLVNEAMRVFAREKGYLRPEADSRAVPKLPPTGMKAPPPLPPPHLPPPRPAHARPPAPAPAHDLEQDTVPPPLFLVFNNQRYLIDKEQFIIGRGAKSSDLAIRDGNISRKHAAVIRRNGGYFIKDLGSTNGIDYKGMRIDNKRIDEGDVFHLCDYELRFTYRR